MMILLAMLKSPLKKMTRNPGSPPSRPPNSHRDQRPNHHRKHHLDRHHVHHLDPFQGDSNHFKFFDSRSIINYFYRSASIGTSPPAPLSPKGIDDGGDEDDQSEDDSDVLTEDKGLLMCYSIFSNFKQRIAFRPSGFEYLLLSDLTSYFLGQQVDFDKETKPVMKKKKKKSSRSVEHKEVDATFAVDGDLDEPGIISIISSYRTCRETTTVA
jgi:hypothetical protein